MLVKMGADIQGIGSNVLHRQRRAERSRGCEHDVAPDHIEIGSFMALAGVTGGELRIKDTDPDDLRMIRLVFERLGLRTELDGDDVLVPGDQQLVVPARRRRVQGQGPGRPVARVPGRPDLDRHRARHAVQRARSSIHEWMFENRLVFTDKLVLDGRRHHALRPAPRDRHRAAPAARRARWSRPDIRAGMAMLIAALCAEGRSEIGNIRQIDRGYERIDERLRDLGRAHRARRHRARARVGPRAPGYTLVARGDPPDPSGTRDVLPDEMRELRAITDALRGVFDDARLRRGHTPALEYEAVLARGDAGAPARPTGVFDEHGNVLVAALGHDDPDRARGRHALRDVRAAAALLLRRPRLPRGAPAPRRDARVPAGRHRARRRPRPRRARPRR